MNLLIDKLIIILMTCVFSENIMFENLMFENLILYLMITLILDVSYIILKLKNIKFFTITIYIILTLYDNNFIYFYPILVYNFAKDIFNNKYLSLLTFPLLSINFNIVLILTSLTSFLLGFRAAQDFYKKLKIFKIRDDLIEKNLRLYKEKNNIIKDTKRDEHLKLLEERNRISRTIHDSIGHTISGTILQLEAINSTNNNVHLRKNIKDIQQNLRFGMTEIRKALHELKSTSIDLEEELKKIKYSNINIDYLIKGCNKLKFNLKLDLISIVKEAITNSIKHSNSTDIKIKIIEQSNFVSLSIKDNGSKVIVVNKIKSGIGLLSVKEISNKYNGNYDISYDNGFKIYLNLRKD